MDHKAEVDIMDHKARVARIQKTITSEIVETGEFPDPVSVLANARCIQYDLRVYLGAMIGYDHIKFKDYILDFKVYNQGKLSRDDFEDLDDALCASFKSSIAGGEKGLKTRKRN
jgi:hypothetical protein